MISTKTFIKDLTKRRIKKHFKRGGEREERREREREKFFLHFHYY